jgi:hypothetical protein
MNNLFEGRLVRLRALEPGDAEAIFRQLQDTEISRRDAIVRWPRSLAEIRRKLESPAEAQPTDDKELAIETLDGLLEGNRNILRRLDLG